MIVIYFANRTPGRSIGEDFVILACVVLIGWSISARTDGRTDREDVPIMAITALYTFSCMLC